MKKQTLCAVVLAAASVAAQAQSTPNPLRGFVGMAFTGGGETLVTVTYSDGTSKNIKSGGLIDLKLGADYRVNDMFSLQGSVGFHTDSTSASNGSVRFTRFPIELLGYWHASPAFRLGGGVRVPTGAKLRSSGVAASLGDTSFDTSAGVVLEGEYFFSPHFGLGLRAVKETYEVGGSKIDGDHVGLRLNYYF
jgi:hypothetical protein